MVASPNPCNGGSQSTATYIKSQLSNRYCRHLTGAADFENLPRSPFLLSPDGRFNDNIGQQSEVSQLLPSHR